ncbi:MAG: FtsX-like permease family protein [Pseudoruegeria sp.]
MTDRVTIASFKGFLLGDAQADRAVPPTGFTASLTVFAAAAMSFLAVFALALSLTTERIAERWSEELAQTATIRISAPDGQIEAQTEAALRVLRTTPGVSLARVLTSEEQRELLSPWFGPNLPIDSLPLPQLIEIEEGGNGGLDAEGLRQRLAAEVPGAVLDDHAQWRAPLVQAADRIRGLGLISLVLIAATMAVMITLAANAALSANSKVIGVMRLVGARDVYIARAFVRRYTIRALMGAVVGTVVAMLAVAFLPQDATQDGFLTGLGFERTEWLWPTLIPVLAAFVAFWATRTAALRTLKEIT